MSTTESGALFSPCARYRYELWRRWDLSTPPVTWIMLNPSTAGERVDDPTIRKCMKFARTWGFGGIRVVNLFAYRATNPKDLWGLGPQVAVGPECSHRIVDALQGAGLVVAAWGRDGSRWGRSGNVRAALIGSRPHALRLTNSGEPYHPLYLPDDTEPFLLEARETARP